ncbi:Nre family DNA repair protein [Candidatus Micrarchaeota archaeon]|nr:Nre family DNA repair protein [Candidatus Micrarchaeota archaeon]MBU1166160.1 Nre family DNA repair protein [Candidatus Micrarchaeota archaeon]MBU1886557.1 Nre family DNA repair protein [Candidatus Micrarchaeota archaeon]
MGIGKGAYLKKITAGTMKWRSIEVGEKVDGSSPPSVFIGAYGYPKVCIGPMLTPSYGDTTILDRPEEWIPKQKNQEDIIRFRLDLVRGKQEVGIKDLENKMVGKLQEISLATNSVESEAMFKHKPKGITFNEEHQPFGPSGSIDKFDIGNVKWDQNLEYTFYDTDLKASNAFFDLYKEGTLISQIQKALSTGTMGIGKNRKLVPTRWSITAVDSSLASALYGRVKYYDVVDNYRVYEFSSLNNYYAIILTPTPWMYEWLEAFIHVMGKEEFVFSDYEYTKGKSEYSCVGGCYYSCKFGVLEALERMKKQAGAIVLREAYEGYVPLGVFNVRENVRHALEQQPREFESFRSAMNYVSTKLKLPISRFIDQGVLIKEMLKYRQTTL